MVTRMTARTSGMATILTPTATRMTMKTRIMTKTATMTMMPPASSNVPTWIVELAEDAMKTKNTSYT